MKSLALSSGMGRDSRKLRYANDNAPQRSISRLWRGGSRYSVAAITPSNPAPLPEFVLTEAISPKVIAKDPKPKGRFKPTISILLNIMGLMSLAWLAYTALMSPVLTYAATGSLIFIVGAALHRSGKAMKDFQLYGASWHTLIGWVTAVLGASIVQQLWVGLGVDPVAQITAMPKVWVYGIGGASLAIFLSSLARFVKGKINVLGMIAVSILTLLLPYATFRPDYVMATFSAFPGVAAAPGFALIIGAAIMASAIGMIAAGLKQNKISFAIAGLCVFGVQVLLLAKPGLLTLEFGLITLLSLVTGLAIGGLVAGSNFGSNR